MEEARKPARGGADRLQEAFAFYPDPVVAVTTPVLVPEDSPRRRMAEVGPQSLSAAELFALVLGSETRATVDAASRALSAVGGLFGLRRASREDLRGLPGVGEARAAALLAAAELGSRMHAAQKDASPAIKCPADVDRLLRGRIAHEEREHFVSILLDVKNRVLGSPTISVGTLTASLVHPREVFRPAIRAAANEIVLAHNHPSGHTEPSREDREVTKRLREAGESIGIEVIDHVIIGSSGYHSLKEHGQI